jgi:hypothetical protein
MMVETEIGRRGPDDFEQPVKIATRRFYAGELKAMHMSRRHRGDRTAEMRSLERHAQENLPWPDLRRALPAVPTAHRLGFPGQERATMKAEHGHSRRRARR